MPNDEDHDLNQNDEIPSSNANSCHIPTPRHEINESKPEATKKKAPKKLQNEKIKNHVLQSKNKQEIIAEYITIETNLAQKEKEINENKEEITLLKCFREKYNTARKILEETAKSNDKSPSAEIARLQQKIIDQEENIKENTTKLVEYRISTTRKMSEIKKLKESVSTNLSKVNELEGLREQTQGRISRTEELLNVKTHQIESLEI